MAVIENRRIDIYGHNVRAANENGVEELTKFVNKLIEKYFNGDLVEIEKENKDYFMPISQKACKGINEIINSVLNKVEYVPPRQERNIKVIDEEKQIIKRSKHRRTGGDLSGWRYDD